MSDALTATITAKERSVAIMYPLIHLRLRNGVLEQLWEMMDHNAAMKIDPPDVWREWRVVPEVGPDAPTILEKASNV